MQTKQNQRIVTHHACSGEGRLARFARGSALRALQTALGWPNANRLGAPLKYFLFFLRLGASRLVRNRICKLSIKL